MNLSEAELYHQIHPFKLTVDIGAAVVSLYLIWQQQLVYGLIVHFIPPILASILVIQFSNLEKQKNSPLGAYVQKYMNRLVEAVRLFGDLVMILGAWYQEPVVIIAGLIIIGLAWFNGKIIPRSSKVNQNLSS